jgi:hypothetical protein
MANRGYKASQPIRRGDDHPNRGPHIECLVDHGGRGVPRHCRRGCKPWPCKDASIPGVPERKPRHEDERETFKDPLYCREPDCEERTKTDNWAKRRAATLGWFFSREGWATCPKHKPDWLDSWRDSRDGL